MKEKYTQREWDRVVGIGKVPEDRRYKTPEQEEADKRFGQPHYGHDNFDLARKSTEE